MKQCLRFIISFFTLLLFSTFTVSGQTVYNYAGDGTPGNSGNGGAATSAELGYPIGLVFDASGNLIITDPGNNTIRSISPSGVINLLAGTGVAGYGGDGGAATSALLNSPVNAAVDSKGNIYIADANNNRIRKISPTGVITTVAGSGTAGFSGDGGPATSAKLNTPNWVAVDNVGNIYISDDDNIRIRKVDTSGIIHTIAGTGTHVATGTGNNGAATSATFAYINAITFDGSGNLYVSDNNQIRKIDTSGIIKLVAGTGTGGWSGDNGPALSAKLENVWGLAFDAMGNIYVSDYDNYCVRKINTSGIITTVAGSTTGGNTGDGGPALLATFNSPIDLKFDAYGTLYIADVDDSRIRKVVGYGIGAITGSNIAYADSTDTLYNATAGGKWFSSSPYIAWIDSTSGVVYTVDTTGEAKIVYVAGSDSAVMDLYVVGKTTDTWPETIPTIDSGHAPIGDDCSIPIVYVPGALYPYTLYICPNDSASIIDSFTLPTGFVADSFSWSPSAGVYPAASSQSGSTTPTITTFNAPASSTTYTLTISGYGPNLIQNGQFITQPGDGCATWYHDFDSYYGNGCNANGNNFNHIKVGNSTCMDNSQGMNSLNTLACQPSFDGHTGSSPNLMLVVRGNAYPLVDTNYAYFWGQRVTLCPGATYQFTYWMRNLDPTIDPAPGSPYYVPQIGVYVGNCCGFHTTEYADIDPATLVDDRYIGGWPACDTGWHEAQFTFTPQAGQSFIEMTCFRSSFVTFAIDDIELHRLTAGSSSITVAPYPPPGENVQSSPSTVCGGPAFFDIYGGTGDIVYYTFKTPSGSISHDTHTMAEGLWDTVVYSTNAGIATFIIDSVKEAAPAGCTFKVADSTSVTFEPQPQIIPTDTVEICQGQITGTLSFTSTNSPTTYTLTWLNGGFTNITSQQTLNDPLTIIVSSGAAVGLDSAHITVYNSTCSSTKTIYVRINPNPAAITLSHDSVCVGSTITATDATAGGAWSVQVPPGNISITGSGTVTGTASGTGTIIYTLPTGCKAQTSVIVNPLPTAIVNSVAVCKGITSATLFFGSGSPLLYNISWTTHAITEGFANQNIGALSMGTPYNVPIPANADPGTDTGTLTITNTVTGCIGILPVIITIKSLPGVMAPGALCLNQVMQMSDTPSLGDWAVINGTGSAQIGYTSGMLTPQTSGNVKVVYIAPDGCTDTTAITINPLPNAGTISDSGQSHFCEGTTHILSESVLHGSWSSSNPSIISIVGSTANPATATVNAIHVGTAIISYVDTNTFGCTNTAAISLTVDTNAVGPIIGVLGVCQGYTTPLFDGVPGGVWSSSDTTVASIDPSTGLVSGHVPGMVTITYMLTNACGVESTTVTLVVNMPPYITAYSNLGCQTLSDPGDPANGTTSIITDTSGCVNVCDSTVVRFYANGNYGSHYTWSVVGGNIVTTYPSGDSVDIEWLVPGVPAQITLADTLNPCNGSTTVCINVVQRPHAAFAVLPDLTPAGGIYTICHGATINFDDLSTASASSPIVTWLWNFGDGTTSAVENASHTFTTPGVYTVILTVKTACNCTNSYQAKFVVTSAPAATIACESVVCESGSASYTVSPECGSYYWTAVGGTITSSPYASTITVNWNAVNPAIGYGYLTLIEPCSGCPDTATLPVPVIPTTGTITGPDTICANEQYDYSLPLWAGTDYQWGVLSTPSAITTVRNDHIVTVDFTSTGTYTLHGWYQNPLTLCGGNVFKTIVVTAPITISGDMTPCQLSTQTYTINGGSGGTYNWTLQEPDGSTASGTGSGYTFTHGFTQPGRYILNFTGAFCFDPVAINVQALPPGIDSVVGPDTVCLNRVYTYQAYNDTPGSIYNWQITGGTITPESGSSTVTVVWTSSGTKTLTVNRANVFAPNCPGPTFTKPIIQEQINPAITGDSLPCSNGYRLYSANYNRGESYVWTISPSTAGSIVSGKYASIANVLWNNATVATSATVQVVIEKCDTQYTKTYHVTIEPSPAPVINGPTAPFCPGTPIQFVASTGSLNYVWDFGDGSPQSTTSSDTVVHTFPPNLTTNNASFTVKVIYSGGTTTCPVSGTASMIVTEKPGPAAYALPNGANWTGANITLMSSVSNNLSGLTYQWYIYANTLISGATNANYTTNDSGHYYYIVTAGNGCSAMSNIANILPPTPTPNDTTQDSAKIISSVSCATINVIGQAPTGSTSPQLHILPPGYSNVSEIDGYAGSFTFNQAGIFTVEFQATAPVSCNCYATNEVQDTVAMVPNYTYHINCSPSGPSTDSVYLSDNSSYLPFITIDSIRWLSGDTVGPTILGHGANIAVGLSAPGTHQIEEQVYYTGPDGWTYCSVVKTITVDVPNATFMDSIGTICEGVPVYFTPTNPQPGMNYYWQFGDTATSLLQTPQRTYTFPGSGTSESLPVILSVTDSIGCIVKDTAMVTIYHNILAGAIEPGNEVLCPNSVPFTLYYLPNPSTPSATNYLWSNGATTATLGVTQSGEYWVTIKDIHQCQQTIPRPPVLPTRINVLHTPPANITGQNYYCTGSTVSLSGYVGDSVLYQWYRDSVAHGTTPYISDPLLGVGVYHYQLVITAQDPSTGLHCRDTSAMFTVYMNAPSPAPTITGPTLINCNQYKLVLNASESVSGTYNWTNGAFGPNDTVYSGGPYGVIFTNQYGCTSSAFAYVPLAPNYYAQYFPSGCYSICPGLLPVTLPGSPVGSFFPWEWLDSTTIVESGSFVMQPYTITGAGAYSWSLNNQFCTLQTPPLNLSVDSSCVACRAKTLTVNSLSCASSAAGYTLSVTIATGSNHETYTLGSNIGPVLPFTGILPTAGVYTLTLTFTTLVVPPPGSMTVELMLTDSSGNQCSAKATVTVPTCSWVSERVDSNANSNPVLISSNATPATLSGNSLLVFPNPSSGEVTLSYDYGTGDYERKALGIYDMLGQQMSRIDVKKQKGDWKINTSDWADGIYVIQMEADGNIIQSQKLIISH